VALLALCLVFQLATPSPAPRPRIARLQVWLAAVEQHQSRTIDEPARRVLPWGWRDLDLLCTDIRTIATLMRDPRVTTFLRVPDRNRSARRARLPEPVAYSDDEMTEMRALATALARRSDANRLLLRGALLHTDLAVLVPYEGGSDDQRSTPPRSRDNFRFEDGRPLGFVASGGHWQMARGLVDELAADPVHNSHASPAHHPLTRRWYEATLALMVNREYLVRAHFDRALELFPDDPGILVFTASMHETLASPRFQHAIRSGRWLARELQVKSERDELRRAEELYRRALRHDVNHLEAQVRLGRVLTAIGASREALDVLGPARSPTTEPVLQYYASLFTAAAASALADWRLARDAYDRAAALFPRAQAPRIGLSQLASREGDWAGARHALESVLDASERYDPMWAYHTAPGRAAEALLQSTYTSFPPGLYVP
jgi:hypothetical protein